VVGSLPPHAVDCLRDWLLRTLSSDDLPLASFARGGRASMGGSSGSIRHPDDLHAGVVEARASTQVRLGVRA
jgi:hypothetical protein